MKYFSILSIINKKEEEVLYQAKSYDEAMATYEKSHNTINTSIMRFKLEQSNNREILKASNYTETPTKQNLYKIRFKRENININRLIPDKIRDNYITATSFNEAVLNFVTEKMQTDENESISSYDLDIQKIHQEV